MEELFENTMIHRSAILRSGSHGKNIHPTTEALISIFNTLVTWIERARQRRALESLPDYMLKDIGVSRVDAWLEAEKPFWRA